MFGVRQAFFGFRLQNLNPLLAHVGSRRARSCLETWRKQRGRGESIQLNDKILLERSKSNEQPELLAEVSDGLLSMTEANWQELSIELASKIKAVMD
jgi:hypothetical protein